MHRDSVPEVPWPVPEIPCVARHSWWVKHVLLCGKSAKNIGLAQCRIVECRGFPVFWSGGRRALSGIGPVWPCSSRDIGNALERRISVVTRSVVRQPPGNVTPSTGFQERVPWQRCLRWLAELEAHRRMLCGNTSLCRSAPRGAPMPLQ